MDQIKVSDSYILNCQPNNFSRILGNPDVIISASKSNYNDIIGKAKFLKVKINATITKIKTT